MPEELKPTMFASYFSFLKISRRERNFSILSYGGMATSITHVRAN
jgi:hypothetical protein